MRQLWLKQRSAEFGLDLAHLSEDPVEDEDAKDQRDKDGQEDHGSNVSKNGRWVCVDKIQRQSHSGTAATFVHVFV